MQSKMYLFCHVQETTHLSTFAKGFASNIRLLYINISFNLLSIYNYTVYVPSNKFLTMGMQEVTMKTRTKNSADKIYLISTKKCRSFIQIY